MADRARHSITWLILLCTALSVPFVIIPVLHNVALVLVLMWVVMFASSGFIVLSVTYANAIYSADHAGLIAGMGAGSWSALIAITMPYFGKLFDSQQYAVAFWVAACFPLVGFVGWVLLAHELTPKNKTYVYALHRQVY